MIKVKAAFLSAEQLLTDYFDGAISSDRQRWQELRYELLRRLQDGWKPISTAPKDGAHILAADFSGKGCGFGKGQSYQCVVHWWEWSDGTHQDEWGWYPSTGAGESLALTGLTHWRPLEELA